jgi:hypothetical protein
MTLPLFKQLEHIAKRRLSDGEIAEIGKVLSLRNLPRDEGKRKWVYFRAMRKARLRERAAEGELKP